MTPVRRDRSYWVCQHNRRRGAAGQDLTPGKTDGTGEPTRAGGARASPDAPPILSTVTTPQETTEAPEFAAVREAAQRARAAAPAVRAAGEGDTARAVLTGSHPQY